MENLFKSFTKDIEEKFNTITKQLADVNDRIKLIEIKTGLDKPKPQSNMNSSKNNSPKYSMEYIPTHVALKKSLLSVNKPVINTNENSNQESNSSSNNKRLLAESDNFSSDDSSSKFTRGKGVTSTLNKSRRKSIRLHDNEDKTLINNNK